MKKLLGIILAVAAVAAFADWQDLATGGFTVGAFHPHALVLSQGVLLNDATVAKITISQDNYCFVPASVQVGTEVFWKVDPNGTTWRTRSGAPVQFGRGALVEVNFQRALPGRCAVNWQAQATDNAND